MPPAVPDPVRDYEQFVDAVRGGGDVFTVGDARGIPCPMGDGGRRAMPFWSSQDRARAALGSVGAFRGLGVLRIARDEFLGRWLPGLADDGMNAGCNWSGEASTGYDVDPGRILKAVAPKKAPKRLTRPAARR